MPKNQRSNLQKRRKINALDKYKDKHRGTSSERGYGRRWQKARKAYLNRNPLCCMCEIKGRVEAATLVDHIFPHKGDRLLFWNKSNWQPLCTRCHNVDKKRMECRWAKDGLTYGEFIKDTGRYLT